MPSLNIITWNSTGESQEKADRLRDVIDFVTNNGWQPQAIVIQEANVRPGGAIATMLAGLGGGYAPAPTRALEGGNSGRAYLLTTHAGVAGQASFTQANLAADATLLAYIQRLNLRQRQQALDEVRGLKMPAVAQLAVGTAQIDFLTWHTPIGPGPLLGGTAQGGANLDAYLFLQESSYFAQLSAPGAGDVGIIAGDLNATVDALQEHYGYPALPYLLPGFAGFANRLDHILGRGGGPASWMTNDGFFDAPGDHHILVGTVNW